MLNKTLAPILAGLTLLLVGIQAHAVLSLTPASSGMIAGDTITTPTGPSNCEAGCIYDAFNLTEDGSLVLLYKSDAPDTGSTGIGSDNGTFASSYQTTFSNTATDPADALIDYISGSAITCPDCYLAVKDGNHDPSYYFYNLGASPAWNGTDDIVLTGFWPNGGAISHVSIWGKERGTVPPTDIPEPTTLALLGLGMLALGAIRRRKVA